MRTFCAALLVGLCAALAAVAVRGQCWGQAPSGPVRIAQPVSSPSCGNSECLCDTKGAPCGCERPCGCKIALAVPAPTPMPEPAAEPLTGVVSKHIQHGKTSYCGQEVTRRQAFAALREAGRLPDDKGKLWLTVIGSAADRKRVLADLEAAPALAGQRGKLLIQDYAPDSWAVTQAGMIGTGSPTIYVQRTDGKVLHRQDDYGGPEGLAVALRRASPDYDPTRDPDLRQPPAPPGPGPQPPPLVQPSPSPEPTPAPAPAPNLPTWFWLVSAVGGALLLLLLTRKDR